MERWEQKPTDNYHRQVRWYAKKRKRELAAVQVNLDAYFTALREGTPPLQLSYRFIRPEGRGVVAIAQWGLGQNLAETRLYVYPDASEKVLYLLTIGDKNSQREDVKQCHEYVKEIEKRKSIPKETSEGESGEDTTETL